MNAKWLFIIVTVTIIIQVVIRERNMSTFHFMYRFYKSTHFGKMVIFRTFVAFFPLAGHTRLSLCLSLPQYWHFCSCFCCFLSVRPDRLPVCSRPWSARFRWRLRPFPLLIASTACVVWLLIACACDWLCVRNVNTFFQGKGWPFHDHFFSNFTRSYTKYYVVPDLFVLYSFWISTIFDQCS